MLRISDSIVELGRAVRFGFVGLLATLVYACATVLAVEALRLSPIPASIVGVATAAAVSYFGHALYSFSVKPSRFYLWRFLLIAALTLGLNIGVTWLLTAVLGLSYRISVGVVMVLIPVTNYLCNRFWVFLPGIEPPTRAIKNSPRASGKS